MELIAVKNGVVDTHYATGWKDEPEAVAAMRAAWEARGMPADFSRAAPHLMQGADDAPVFFWDAEEKLFGAAKPSWNQLQVGSCVGFGTTRMAQDLLLWEIFCGEAEEYPGSDLCPEVTYGGSRVEIGGGSIGGDGSVGAWAYEFGTRFGFVKRGKYGTLDLTSYNERTCRALGNQGLPTDLEAVAKEHPIQAAAFVKTGAEVWAALGAGKPVVVCSNRGFTMQRDSRGYCSRSGTWNHCMGLRGRFVEPDVGPSVVDQNSWGDYLGSANRTIRYVGADGKVYTKDLPQGCFAIKLDVAGEMASQGDTAALAGFRGWQKTRIDLTP